MRAISTAWLAVGFGIGFGVMYSYVSPRAADLAKPFPQFVPQSASAPPAPQGNPAVIKKLQDVLISDPKNFEALRELGNVRYDERNFAEAAELYARALVVHPNDVDVRSDRGGALLQARQIDDAIEELKIALEKDPNHPQALYILGVALLEGRGDRQGALEKWRHLIATHPDLPQLDEVKRQIQRVEELTKRN